MRLLQLVHRVHYRPATRLLVPGKAHAGPPSPILSLSPVSCTVSEMVPGPSVGLVPVPCPKGIWPLATQWCQVVLLCTFDTKARHAFVLPAPQEPVSLI